MKTLRSAFLFIGAVVALLVPSAASAHVLQSVGTTVVQDVGPYELATTMAIPNTLPAPLSVQIVSEQQFGGVVAITLWLVPTGAPLPPPPPAQVISAQGTVVAQFPITDPGNYELALQVSGQNGGGEARVPVTVATQADSWVVGVILAALGMFAAIICGAIAWRLSAHRRRVPLSTRTQRLLTSTMAGCAAIALVAFVATQFMPANAATPAANAASYTQADVNVELHPDLQAGSAGQPVDLLVDVTEAATGLPVDDLVPDHNVLMQLFVMSADQGFFQHMYRAYVEVMRAGSSRQVVARGFSVSGPAVDPQAEGVPVPGGLAVAFTTIPTNVRPAEPVALTFTFTKNGPAVPLAPHLGVAGDLVVTNTDGMIFGHVRATDLATSGLAFPTAAAAASTPPPVGPTVHFAYIFPAPGHYSVWAEVKRTDTGVVVTVPTSVDIHS